MSSLVRASIPSVPPSFSRAKWCSLHDLLARRFRTPDRLFMNDGCVPSDPTRRVTLGAEDEPHRCFIQLYADVIRPAGHPPGGAASRT